MRLEVRHPDIQELIDRFGNYWDEDPRFPLEDWQHEVASDYTRQGYWEWVAGKINLARDLNLELEEP